MGQIVWNGYRWCGPIDATRRRPDFPPKLPRHWTRYPDTCVRQWTSTDEALTWLWNQMADVHNHLITKFPRQAEALPDEYATAKRQLLDGDDFACHWSIVLPESILLCLGVVEVYQLPSHGGESYAGPA